MGYEVYITVMSSKIDVMILILFLFAYFHVPYFYVHYILNVATDISGR